MKRFKLNTYTREQIGPVTAVQQQFSRLGKFGDFVQRNAFELLRDRRALSLALI